MNFVRTDGSGKAGKSSVMPRAVDVNRQLAKNPIMVNDSRGCLRPPRVKRPTGPYGYFQAGQ